MFLPGLLTCSGRYQVGDSHVVGINVLREAYNKDIMKGGMFVRFATRSIMDAFRTFVEGQVM